MDQIVTKLFDESEKSAFLLEQEEWFSQWNRLGLESVQSDQFEEKNLMRLKEKIDMGDVQRKLIKELKEEKHNLALLQRDFEKQKDELQCTKSEKEQLMAKRDGLLLQLQNADGKTVLLHEQLDEQSKSMQEIAQNFGAKLAQNQEIRQQLLNDVESLDANYTKQMHQLKQKTDDYIIQKEQLVIQRDGLLLKLQEVKSKTIMLCDQIEEQYESMLSSSQNFNLMSSQNEETRLQLLRNLSIQDGNYAKQMEELHAKTEESLDLQYELDSKREIMCCPICLFPWEELGAHRLVALPCGHLFGYRCIRDHLAACWDCPICRQRIESNRLIFIHGRSVGLIISPQ